MFKIGNGYWIDSYGKQIRTEPNGCETNIADVFSKLYEKDDCFIILKSELANDLVTEMYMTDGLEEQEELKITSNVQYFTELLEFEETTEFFDFEHIKTDFNFEFEEIHDT